MHNNIENYLDICIVTYNRSKYLRKTLETLHSSILQNCNIYVLDNCSTDETQEIAYNFKPSVKYIRNKFNIGGNANILRAYETGDRPYIWVIGDDDDYNLSDIKDLLKVFQEGSIDLIHVGAHVDSDWNYGGKIYNTRDLFDLGYHFFKYSSFIGCNIIKRDAFAEYVISGYNNIANSYPHMPYLLSFYENNKPIYISKNRICRAVIGNQGYNYLQMINWWSNTCKILVLRSDQKECFFDQFQKESLKLALRIRYLFFKSESIFYKNNLITTMSFFSNFNKSLSLILLPFYIGYRYLNKLIREECIS